LKGTFGEWHEKTLQDFLSRSDWGLRLLLRLSGLSRWLRSRCAGSASEQLSHAAWSVLAISTNDVGLGAGIESKFVDLNVGSVGDQPDQTLFGKEIEDLLKRICKLSEFFRMRASVHDEEKCRRSHVGDAGEFILACGILRDELGG
jgi:hypothetical protein